MSPKDTTPPTDALASTIPAPPPTFYDSVVQDPPKSGPRLHAGPAWFYTDDRYDWDGFASEALDEE